WIMGTYCYQLFNYFGYIWLTSLGPECGKSLVAKIISMLAFNASPPLIDPTPAAVFRDIEANGSTFILDEAEYLEPEKRTQLLGILNGGFERGAQVPRIESDGKKQTLKKFDIYSPKVVAGISQIPRVLLTRVFQIEMRKRKKGEKITSFEPDRREKWASRVRDNLSIFALQKSKEIAEKYAERSKIVPRKSKDG